MYITDSIVIAHPEHVGMLRHVLHFPAHFLSHVSLFPYKPVRWPLPPDAVHTLVLAEQPVK